MSIVDCLDPTAKMRDDLRKQHELLESMTRLGAQFGLTKDEVLDGLWHAVNQKRLRDTQNETIRMAERMISL